MALKLALKRLDGRIVDFVLTVESHGTRVWARETAPLRLPAFCPERHINLDGSFCLNWEGEQVLEILDEPSARVWWETLYRFLLDQERVSKLRRWPTSDGWAHGDAAGFQKSALLAAGELGERFVEALYDRSFTVVSQPRRGSNLDSIVDVMLRDHRLYSVWTTRQRVVNKKQPCFCQSDRPKRAKRIGRCRAHAEAARDLALALKQWEAAEAEFWRVAAERPCCGTCSNCPLSTLATRSDEMNIASPVTG